MALAASHPFKKNPPLVDYEEVLWTPQQIPTALWLDANESSTISLVSTKVSQWNDKSGNGRHAVQSTDASRPEKTSAGVVFDGVDDYFSFQANPPQAFGQQIIAVVDTTSLQTGSRLLLNSPAPSSPYPPALYLGCGDGSLHRYPSVYWGTNWQNQYTGAVQRLAIFGFSILSGGSEIRIDGGVSDYASTAQTVLSSWEALNVANTYSQQSAITIQEVLIFNSVESSKRILVEGYLAHKWDKILGVSTLKTALPVTHPYKTKPPVLQVPLNYFAAMNLEGR